MSQNATDQVKNLALTILGTMVVTLIFSQVNTVSKSEMAYEFTQVRTALNNVSDNVGDVRSEVRDIDQRLSRMEGRMTQSAQD